MSELDNGGEWFGCPLPTDTDGEQITLAYGEGGRLSRRLIRERIVSRFGNDQLRSLGDAAILETQGRRLAFSTDGYTVTPMFFPGGDIGRLAVFGTVNDLAVSGAVPRWLSLSLIIEEGLSRSVLDRVLDSIQASAVMANVTIVTGDTKVVPRGAADQLFITTSGIGEVLTSPPPGPAGLQPDDILLVSGPIGSHGAAILCAREQFDFEPPPSSDCAPLTAPLIALHAAGVTPRAVRDATRGGVAAVLHEWADASRLTCVIEEPAIPINSQVRAVCELLGLDPLHLANEGTFVLGTPADLLEPTLAVLRQFEVSRHATVIGRVSSQRITPVTVLRGIGREVPLDEPSGAPLPRIC
jgi:hydrogenase expression/formation protein HypE